MQVHGGSVVQIVAIVMVFGMIIVGIIGKVIRRIRVNQLIHQERMAAIEKGLPLPSVQDYSLRPLTPKYNLRRGLLWGLVGLGLLISYRFAAFGPRGDTGPFGAIGIICVCVGAAYLIFYFIESRKPDAPQS
ncbi:MAG: DUF6249 domain-containing protein [Candidatus Acidiferrales bacterium]